MSIANLNTQTPSYDQVKPGQVPKQPGTSATDLKTNPPPVRATNLPATSDLHRMTLTEKAAAALGVDPATVHDASVATSALLLGTAGVAWLLSYASPQLRLGLLQNMTKSGPRGGLNAVPFMTTDRAGWTAETRSALCVIALLHPCDPTRSGLGGTVVEAP
jgi:hypothetical protein